MKNNVISSELYINSLITRVDSNIIILKNSLLIFSNGNSSEEIFDEIDLLLNKKTSRFGKDVKFFVLKLEGEENEGDAVTIFKSEKKVLIRTCVHEYIEIQKISNIFIYDDCFFLQIDNDDLNKEEKDVLSKALEDGLNDALVAHEFTKDSESSCDYILINNEDIEYLILKSD